jgi:apolipoprotein D and lipocalin family protein
MKGLSTYRLFVLFFVMNTTIANAQELKTVSSVDLKKYAGTWYEIASFPQRFQKGYECRMAEYTPIDKGYIIVENRCKRNGKESYIKGRAFI